MGDILKTVKTELTFENVLAVAMRTHGVRIDRAKFLRKELIKYCPEDQIKEAIKTNPAKAGISKQLINMISKQVIKYETTKVTGISVAASLPGGAAVVGAVAADIASYFAFILRIVQELAYLYGFEQFDLSEDSVDSETTNFVLLFMGVMFGVHGAAAALKKMADALAKQVSKKLAKQALAKGVVYPVVKKVVTSIGFSMNKQIFADSVASVIPFIGGALSGGLTLVMFRPACMQLRKNLMSYNLCDPDYYKTTETEETDITDTEFADTDEKDKKVIRVVAAVIRDGDRIFATARGYGEYKGWWEFPGGKIEAGETPEEALVREIHEELDTEIRVGELIDTIEYDYPTFHLSMDCFWAEVIAGRLVLKEAEDARWLTKETLESVQWLPADQTIIDAIYRALY